jgi:PAS domain S-box-containing protein
MRQRSEGSRPPLASADNMEVDASHFQSLVNNIPGISYRCRYDADWTMLFISTHVDHVTGYSAEELLNSKEVSYASLIPTEDNVRAGRIVAEAVARNEPWKVEYRVMHKSGEIRWASERGQAVLGEDGQVLYLDGFILDITEEKNAKQAMERLAVLVRNSSEAMFLLRDHVVFDCNDAALALFGHAKEELIAHSSYMLSPPQQADGSDSIEMGKHHIELAASGIPQRFEWVYCRRDGSIFDAEVSLNRFLENEDVVVTGIIRDISERKQREREIQELNATLERRVAERTAELEATLEHLQRTQHELLQSEKLASLGALVAGVAHELNTPIGNAVTVSSSLVDVHRQFVGQVESGLTRKALQGFLTDVGEGSQIIERNLSRAAELVSSFKQLAVDQTSYQRRSFNLRDVVHEIILTMKPTLRRTAIALHEDIPEELTLDGHPGPLGQVLMNLINNAIIHAYPEGAEGKVQLSATPEAGNGVRILVQDWGCGMDEGTQKRIFDPFFTTRMGRGGSGLGLHIAYTLTTGILGGRMSVTSRPGEGSVFELRLPLSAPTEASV